MVCVYAVFKEGLKVYKRHLQDRYPLDGVIDVSWQRGLVEPNVVTLRRSLGECKRVLLVESSSVSGTTIEIVAAKYNNVNFIVAAEKLDFYGAFYTDYVIAGGGLARVERIWESGVRLDTGDTLSFRFGRGELIEGPSYMWSGGEELVRAAVRSWLEGRPLIPRDNKVYWLIERTETLVKRVELVRSVFMDVAVDTPRWRLLVYERFWRKFSPTVARAIYRALLYMRERGFTKPLTLGVVDRLGRIATIGHSIAYPAIYRAGHPIYVVYRDTSHPTSEAVDVEELRWWEVSI